MTDNKLARNQKAFLKAMKKKFSEDPEDRPQEADPGASRVISHPTLIPYRRSQ